MAALPEDHILKMADLLNRMADALKELAELNHRFAIELETFVASDGDGNG